MTELKTVPFSNFYDWDENGKELYRDRLYGGITGKDSLVNKDGTVYSGKVEKKRITVKGSDGNNFFSHVYETADGRWFDNAGMPIEAPDKLEPEKVKSAEEIEEEQQAKANIAKRKEAQILANLK